VHPSPPYISTLSLHDALPILPHHFDLIVRAFAKLGVEIEHEGDTAIVRRGQKLVIEEPFTSNLLPKIEAAPWPYFSVDLLPLMRSEEHTSELQSRENLVCRLL